MDPWVVWIVVAAALGVGELLSLSLFLAPFAGGALAAALVDGIGGGTPLALVVFLAVSVVLLGALRPVARRHLRTPASLRTGTAALVGVEATVLESVTSDAGSVRLEGEVWTARAYDGSEVIPVGQRVTVVEIKGATALVSE